MVGVKIRKFALLAAIVGVCLLLLTLQTRGYGATARDLLALVTTPIQASVSRAHRAAFGAWDTYRDWKNVRAENHRLRDENQQLRVEALRVGETEDENRRLRHLLALQQRLPLTTLSGEIIARDWGGWIRSRTVNRGRGERVPRPTGAAWGPSARRSRPIDVEQEHPAAPAALTVLASEDMIDAVTTAA